MLVGWKSFQKYLKENNLSAERLTKNIHSPTIKFIFVFWK